MVKHSLLYTVVLLMRSLCAYKIIIVPGLGGSVLYNENQKKIWPPDLKFNFEELAMRYEKDTPIVPKNIRVGNIQDINIDTPATFLFTKTSYYSTLISHLKNDYHTVFAFPYDFRYILYDSYHRLLYQKFKEFIEREEHKDDPFIIVCHSLGGLVLHHFLTTFVHEDWYKRYISKIYFVNVPFGGSPLSLQAILNGRIEDEPLSKSNQILALLKKKIKNFHLYSCFYMTLSISNDPIYKKQNVLYSLENLDRLLAIDPRAMDMLTIFRKDHLPILARGINLPVNIVYSCGRNTTVFYDEDTGIQTSGDGDGIVPIDSLLSPRLWETKPALIRVEGLEHSKILSHLPFLRMVSANADRLIADDNRRSMPWHKRQ